MDIKPVETYVDIETGETIYPSSYNVETGEYEGLPVPHQRITFRVRSTEEEISKKRFCRRLRVDKRELELITAAIFLLPSMVLFYPILGIVTLILEIILHNWAHWKNHRLKDMNFYYKSPLHGITKEFCGRCREHNSKEKITKIQDMRNDKMKRYGLEYIRRVVT